MVRELRPCDDRQIPFVLVIIVWWGLRPIDVTRPAARAEPRPTEPSTLLSAPEFLFELPVDGESRPRLIGFVFKPKIVGDYHHDESWN